MKFIFYLTLFFPISCVSKPKDPNSNNLSKNQKISSSSQKSVSLDKIIGRVLKLDPIDGEKLTVKDLNTHNANIENAIAVKISFKQDPFIYESQVAICKGIKEIKTCQFSQDEPWKMVGHQTIIPLKHSNENNNIHTIYVRHCTSNPKYTTACGKWHSVIFHSGKITNKEAQHKAIEKFNQSKDLWTKCSKLREEIKEYKNKLDKEKNPPLNQLLENHMNLDEPYCVYMMQVGVVERIKNALNKNPILYKNWQKIIGDEKNETISSVATLAIGARGLIQALGKSTDKFKTAEFSAFDNFIPPNIIYEKKFQHQFFSRQKDLSPYIAGRAVKHKINAGKYLEALTGMFFILFGIDQIHKNLIEDIE